MIPIEILARWADYINSDPVSDVEEQKAVIQKQTGQAPDSLLITKLIFDLLCGHPKIIERFKYSFVGMLRPCHLKSLFGLENFFIMSDGQNMSAILFRMAQSG